MKLPKILAYILIAGLLISSASYGTSYTTNFGNSPPRDLPTNTDSLMGTSGGEQNVDPFTVNPLNRWDNTSCDYVTSIVENSEFSLATSEDNFTSDLYYRGSSSADDTISTRWRLNSTADIGSNGSVIVGPPPADYWTTELSDACDWTEDLEDWHDMLSGDSSHDAENGYLVLEIIADNPGSGMRTYPLSPRIDEELYTTLKIRFHCDTNDVFMKLVSWDGALQFVNWTIDIGWHEFTITELKDWDADPAGVVGIRIAVYPADEGTTFLFDYFQVWSTGEEYIDLGYGDFAVPLSGLNATTVEGTANITLSAFPYNSTDYSIRPTLTTSDGVISRSWNMDSDYQDYAQLSGEWGSDGWEWIVDDNDEDWNTGLLENTIEYGYIESERQVSTSYSSIFTWEYYDQVPRETFPFITFKFWANHTGTVQIGNQFSFYTVDPSYPGNIWTTYIVDSRELGSLSDDWAGDGPYNKYVLLFLDGDGSNIKVLARLDYVRFTTKPFHLITTDYAIFSERWDNHDAYGGNTGWSYNQLDDFTGLDTNTVSNGIFIGRCAAGSNDTLLSPNSFIPSYLFNQVEIRIKSNATNIYFDLRDSANNSIGSYYNLTTSYQTLTWDISSNANWTGIESKLNLLFSEWGSALDGDEGIWIDYILIKHEDTTLNSIDLYKYNEYYRSELEFNLRTSELEFEIQDDSGSAIVKEKNGEFAIDIYFDADDLIPDIYLADVGHFDYLFGIMTAGSATTCWWDYYEAEFTVFSWELTNSTGRWQGLGPYACHLIDNSAESAYMANFSLVVPEFDSASGRIVIDELNDTDHIYGQLGLYIWSVDSKTGVLSEEARIYVSGGSVGGTYYLTMDYNISGTMVHPKELYVDNGKTSFGEITFSIHFDKQNDFLSIQASGRDSSSVERRISATWPIASDSNEIVLTTIFYASATATGSETIISLEDWSLTSRDIFGIPIDLPSVDDVLGGIFGFLGNIFAALLTPVSSGLRALQKAFETIIRNLGNILGDIIDEGLSFIGDAIELFTEAIAALAEEIWKVITDGLSILLTAVLGILQDITDAGVNFMRGIGVGGTTIGDVLDIIGTWLDFFVATVADTIQFILMIMVVWGTMLMVAIFIGIIFFAILGSDNAGQVPTKIWNAYSTNIMPFSIWGFRMHIPLAVLVIPFIFVVIIGVV